MAPTDENPDLIRMAEAVSDGSPMDWDEARRNAGDEPTVEHLRAIESIARVHRAEAARESSGAGPAPMTDSPPDPTRPAEAGVGGSISSASGRETWGPLVMIERIGRGAFADVYRAFDPSLERDVALKLFRTGEFGSAAHRYLDEARRLAQVRHPNVIAIYGADEHAGRVGLWTELLRGRTLAEWLAEHGPLSSREVAVIGMELCLALGAVHAAGLVHRDVKAENVMREAGGRLVLLDFGAVDTPSTGRLARVEMGTPITMAPEQLRGGPVGPAADIYGLGVLLYRLATGHFPFETDDTSRLRDMHQGGASVPLHDRRPELPAEFVRVVEKALDPAPEKRHASAGEFERALAGVVASANGFHDEGPAPRRPMRRFVGVAIVAILVLAAALLAVRFGPGAWQPQGERERTATGSNPDVARDETASPAPATAASVAIEVDATLYLDGAAGPQQLRSGDRVMPGDAMFLRLRSRNATYVYVLDEDALGALVALYPVPGTEPINPLAAGVNHRLPGSVGGKPFDWEVTSAGGTESICVIASRAPIDALESELARVPHSRPGVPVSYARIPRAAVHRLRGLAGMTEAIAPEGGSPERLAELVHDLLSRPAAAGRPWVWVLTLENPGVAGTVR